MDEHPVLLTHLVYRLRLAESGELDSLDELDALAADALRYAKIERTIPAQELAVRARLACAAEHIARNNDYHLVLAASLCNQRRIWGEGTPLGLMRFAAASDYNYALALALCSLPDYAGVIHRAGTRAMCRFRLLDDTFNTTRAALIASLSGKIYGLRHHLPELQDGLATLQSNPRLHALALWVLERGEGIYYAQAGLIRWRRTEQHAALLPEDCYRFIPQADT